MISDYSSDNKIEIGRKIDKKKNILKQKFIFTLENLKKLISLYRLPDLSKKKYIILNFSPKYDHYYKICIFFKIKLRKGCTFGSIFYNDEEETRLLNLMEKIFGAEEIQ